MLLNGLLGGLVGGPERKATRNLMTTDHFRRRLRHETVLD